MARRRRKKNDWKRTVMVFGVAVAVALMGGVVANGDGGFGSGGSSDYSNAQPAPAPQPLPGSEGDVPGTSNEPGSPAGTVDAPNGAFFTLSAGQASVAKQQLAGLPVKPHYEGAYKRSDFGQAWTDKATGVAFSGNGCKTRDDILKRDMTNVSMKDRCVVTSGTLWNPYGTKGNPNNDWINFTRGSGTPVDIDHVVALGNAWKSGAYQLSKEERTELANDPINLVAVRGSDNRAKGDKDVSEWVPQNRSIHCGYAASQVQVKSKYHLWVTPAEKHVLEQMLATCPAGV